MGDKTNMKFGNPRRLLLLALLASQVNTATATTSSDTAMGIIPAPESVVHGKGAFVITLETRIARPASHAELTSIVETLRAHLQAGTGSSLRVVDLPTKEGKDRIALAYIDDPELGPEGYVLRVSRTGVRMEANTQAGLFYAVQSFLQLLPVGVYRTPGTFHRKFSVPSLTIRDRPRYSWRGMMLDVSRHFFPKEFVKRYIDLLAFHKMNHFHWHLNDDQGWRIEIKRYPRLTEIGAWRVDREDIHWDARPAQHDGERPTYGGYYTQADIREIVAYANDRFITVVPEIEMPAHATAVLSAYPWLSCTGGPFTLPPGQIWPIKDIYCAGNDSTFAFLENVLNEVTTLFPGEYLHVGGDEADKTEWKRCPKCQARIKNEHLRDETELQSYFIGRIERFLSTRKRRLIGWDEILEGGLPPEASVMSWRGTVGGIAAARAGHDVVMSPNSFCYFDHYQSSPSLEPAANGGYLPLKTVYSYEPTPDSLKAGEAAHILGVQANLWTEFIPTGTHAEYMILPRMAALAEVGWSPKSLRDWNDFARRITKQVGRYTAMNAHFAKSAFTVVIADSFDTATRTRIVTFQSDIGEGSIHYTMDGSAPTLRSMPYTGPIRLTSSTMVRAATFTGSNRLGNISTADLRIGLPVKGTITLTHPFDTTFAGSGIAGLVDNLHASTDIHDSRWNGVKRNDFEAVIDLGGAKPIHKVTTGFLHDGANLAFLPSHVEYSVSSDGISFARVAAIENDVPARQIRSEVKEFSATFRPVSARYLKVRAASLGTCPQWHKSAGAPVWLLVDEVTIE